jgi:signal transduction histidine kinase
MRSITRPKVKVPTVAVPGVAAPLKFHSISVPPKDHAIGYALLASDGSIVSVTDSFAEFLGCSASMLFRRKIHNVLRCAKPRPNGALGENASSTISIKGRPFSWSTHEINSADSLGGRYVGVLSSGVPEEIVEDEIGKRLLHRDRLTTMGRLTASIAHDIAGPLNVIANNADLLLLENGVEPETQDLIVAMRDEAWRLADLLKDVLSFARDSTANVRPQDVVRIVENTIRFLRNHATQKNISLRVRTTTELPPVPVDAPRLQQVLFNLLKNACEASPCNSEVVVELYVAQLKKGQPAVAIKVIDYGSGVSPSE